MPVICTGRVVIGGKKLKAGDRIPDSVVAGWDRHTVAVETNAGNIQMVTEEQANAMALEFERRRVNGLMKDRKRALRQAGDHVNRVNDAVLAAEAALEAELARRDEAEALLKEAQVAVDTLQEEAAYLLAMPDPAAPEPEPEPKDETPEPEPTEPEEPAPPDWPKLAQSALGGFTKKDLLDKAKAWWGVDLYDLIAETQGPDAAAAAKKPELYDAAVALFVEHEGAKLVDDDDVSDDETEAEGETQGATD